MNRTICQLLICVVSAMSLNAAPVTVSGTGVFGSYTGLIEYIGTTEASGSLMLSLTNTTPVYGGYITAVAFNNPGDSITSVTSFSSGDPDFQLLGEPDFDGGVSASPYGDFDLGASLGNGWLGAGSPVAGIAVGETATFTFNFAGNLAGVTTNSFIAELSTGTQTPEALIVRFRGMMDGQSDKVPGTFDELAPPPGEIPEPGTYAMMGLGLGLAAMARKFKKN